MSELELAVRMAFKDPELCDRISEKAREEGATFDDFLYSSCKRLFTTAAELMEATTERVFRELSRKWKAGPEQFHRDLCRTVHEDGGDFVTGEEAREWVNDERPPVQKLDLGG